MRSLHDGKYDLLCILHNSDDKIEMVISVPQELEVSFEV